MWNGDTYFVNVKGAIYPVCEASRNLRCALRRRQGREGAAGREGHPALVALPRRAVLANYRGVVNVDRRTLKKSRTFLVER